MEGTNMTNQQEDLLDTGIVFDDDFTDDDFGMDLSDLDEVDESASSEMDLDDLDSTEQDESEMNLDDLDTDSEMNLDGLDDADSEMNLDDLDGEVSDEQTEAENTVMSGVNENLAEAVTTEDRLAQSLAFSCPVSINVQKLPVEQLIVSNFKKRSRETSIIGLTSIVSQWGIIQPVNVLKLEDDDQYIILDGLRRVFAAIKSGMKEIDCRVWDFEDKIVGKKMANVLSLMITRTERYSPQEQWNMMQILEEVNDLDPGMIEYLTQLGSGEAMKLKDIMTCTDFYAGEIREKLLLGEYTIEAAYKKLANERKKENKLAKEDVTSVEVQGVQGADDAVSDVDSVSDEEGTQSFSNDEVAEMLELASSGIDEAESLEEMNKTDEIRGSDMHQKVGERHPVDPAVRQGTFMRDGFKCRCCGLGGNESYLSVLAFHHAVPVYLGGPDTKENGLTLCVTCHILLHNYLFGQLQVDFDTLSDDEQRRFRNVFKYGNIALEAQKRRGMSKEEAKKHDMGLKHPMPNANLNENRKALEAAKAEGYSLDNDEDE